MDAPFKQVFFPVSFNELFSTWARFPDAVPFAGGTNIIRKQGRSILTLPNVILSLEKLSDLFRITRSEHHLDIGSMVKLNRLLRLGKIVPEVLGTCLNNIAGPQVRNIATVGGNICSVSCLYDLPALFTALDAQYEFRSANTTRWVSASRFHSKDEHNVLKEQEILTRIRLPLHPWDYSVYKKFYSQDIFNNEVLLFLAKAQKNILSVLRVVYKTNTILRNKAGEDILIGKHLPLNRKTANDFVENWKDFISGRNEIGKFSKNALLGCIEENVNNLTN